MYTKMLNLDLITNTFMKFQEFFFGTNGEQPSSEKIEEQVENLAKISRRRFFRESGKVAGLLATGTLANALISCKEVDMNNDTNDKTAEPDIDLPDLIEIGEERVLLSPKEVRSTYNNGFDLITKGVDPSDKGDLAEIIKFKQRLTAWAEIRGYGEIFAMENGFTGNAWLGAISPDSPMADSPGSMVSVDNNPSVNLLRIKPEKITPEWAGIILVHELSHLRDRLLGLEPVFQPTRDEWLGGEVSAYSVEIDAINHFSKGYFKEVLLDLLLQLNSKTVEDVMNLQNSHENVWNGIHYNLDQTIALIRPLSNAEAGVRHSLYEFALCFEVIDKQNLESSKNWRAKLSVIEKILTGDGVDYKIPKE